MTRKEFEAKNFDEVMEQLNEERDDITTIDMLKEFIKEKEYLEDKKYQEIVDKLDFTN